MGAEEELVGAGQDLWDALSTPTPRLLFKHSPHCIVSMGARRRVLELHDVKPDLAIYEIDVIHDRSTSLAAEAKYEIRHESPQAILFVGGVPVWHASHGAVTVDAILEQLERVTPKGW